jgi:hypothetical protein
MNKRTQNCNLYMYMFMIFPLVILKLDSYFSFKQVWTQKCAVQKASADVNISHY